METEEQFFEKISMAEIAKPKPESEEEWKQVLTNIALGWFNRPEIGMAGMLHLREKLNWPFEQNAVINLVLTIYAIARLEESNVEHN